MKTGRAWPGPTADGLRLTPSRRSGIDQAFHDLPGDYDPLDLAGPLPDFALWRRASSLHRVLGGIPISAEDWTALVVARIANSEQKSLAIAASFSQERPACMSRAAV
jgi:hypothetical protein